MIISKLWCKSPKHFTFRLFATHFACVMQNHNNDHSCVKAEELPKYMKCESPMC